MRVHKLNRAVLATVLIVGTVLAVSAIPAFGESCDGEGSIFDGGGDVAGWCDSFQTPAPTNPDPATCVLRRVPAEDAPFLPPNFWMRVPEGYFVGAYYCDGERATPLSFYPEAEPLPVVAPEDVRDLARTRIQPPPPVAATNPPHEEREAVVHVPTWLWLEETYWQPLTQTDAEGAVVVRVEARPALATWSMGEGTTTCEGPGVPWEPGRGEDETYCSYTYTHSSADQPGGRYEARVDVRWDFYWWLNGEPQGYFGSVTVGSPFSVAVGEIQAVQTR